MRCCWDSSACVHNPVNCPVDKFPRHWSSLNAEDGPMTATPKKVRAPDLALMKERGERIVMLSAYDATMLPWSTDDDTYSFVRPGRPILCRKASPCFRRQALDFSRASRSCCDYCGCASQPRLCSWRPVGPSPPE